MRLHATGPLPDFSPSPLPDHSRFVRTSHFADTVLRVTALLQRDVGKWQHLQVLEGVEGFTMAPFTRQLKWSPEEVQVFMANIRRDLKNTKIHAVYT